MLLVSAVLFAVGSIVERSQERSTAAAAERSSATGATPAGSAARRRSERAPETSRSVPMAPERPTTRGEAHGETRSGLPPHAETGSGGSGNPRAASAEPGSGETAAQLSSESGRSLGNGSRAGSGETARERLGERHREAKLLGINPEALSLLVIALIVSVLLAASVWFRPLVPVLIAIVGFGLLFAALDVREVLHQVDESRTSLIVTASALTGLHLLVAMLAAAAVLAGAHEQANVD